jgi:hypothetical protein
VGAAARPSQLPSGSTDLEVHVILSAVTAGTIPTPEAVPEPPRDGPPAPPTLRGGAGLQGTGEAAPLEAVAPRAASDPLSLAGLGACVDEARAAVRVRSEGPPVPTSFSALRARLEKATEALPTPYRRAVAEPLLRSLDQLGPAGLARVLAEDPEQEGEARLLLDLAQAVLQHGEGYQERATSAFQEVVSDLYEGFLSAEERRGVKPPDHGILPPIVRWGGSGDGPYTWPVTATETLGAGAALVSLPAANASAGLLAWPALAHETAGHDVLAADAGLREELARVVERAVRDQGQGPALASYWANRIDETAADVLGVLNMGPAAALGLTGYLRAVNGAIRGHTQLRNVGSAEDPHPADIARAYLAAETVRLLSFRGASRWADRLVAEADRDLGRIWLGGTPVAASAARASAAAVARAVVRTRLGALEGHALGEIQDWRDRDEAVVAGLRSAIQGGKAGRGAAGAERGEGTYAAHAVAAAVYEAAAGSATPARAMAWMLAEIDAMHRANPDWRGSKGRLDSPGYGARAPDAPAIA